MLAVDTNVVVRSLVRDHPRQTAQSDRLLQTEPVLLLKSVLLEVEWVLRYSYGFDRQLIASVLRGLAALPNVRVEDGPAVAQALTWFGAGVDFADALHLAGAGMADGFATFDRRLASAARRLDCVRVRLLG